jgi:large subunit ribosomal protein L10
MQLLKGSLARRVLEAQGLSGLDTIFDGPAAVILPDAGVDVDAATIAAAKAVVRWKKDAGQELPAIKGGVLEGEFLDADAATALEKLPGRAELLSILVGQIVGPARKLAAQLTAPAGRIAGAIKKHIENQEQSG